MRRVLPEWIGKTPDTAIPPRVRLRVFERYGGRCYLCTRKLGPGDRWDCDHVVALAIWTGEPHGNRESNLAPACTVCHREKTAQDVADKSRAYRIKAKHYAKSGQQSKFANARTGYLKTKLTANGPVTVDRRTGHPVGTPEKDTSE